MTRRSRALTCVVTPVVLLLSSTAWGQTVASPTATVSANTGTSPNTGSSTSVSATFERDLRGSFTQLLVTAIQGVFQDLRTSLGLPPVAADPAADPLAMLQSALEDAINSWATQTATGE
jgi:hypothetical protein